VPEPSPSATPTSPTAVLGVQNMPNTSTDGDVPCGRTREP
jgi:hypothetical protein